MDQHLAQAVHNQTFHDKIVEEFPDRFFDWKTTILFYTALHLLQALAAKRKVPIGGTHIEIERNVNPGREGAKMKISRGAWRNYKDMFNYSCTARYDGISDLETFEILKKTDYEFCLKNHEAFKKYLADQGIAT